MGIMKRVVDTKSADDRGLQRNSEYTATTLRSYWFYEWLFQFLPCYTYKKEPRNVSKYAPTFDLSSYNRNNKRSYYTKTLKVTSEKWPKNDKEDRHESHSFCVRK